MIDEELNSLIIETLMEDPHAFTHILKTLTNMAGNYVQFQEDVGDTELARGFKRVEGVLDVTHTRVAQILGTKE